MSKAKKKGKYTPGDFTLKVRRSRAGLGLFAADPIPRHACIIEYTGRLLTDEEYEKSRSRYLFDLGNGKVLDGSPRWNKARYINHSCVPNCETEVRKKHIYIRAARHRAGRAGLRLRQGIFRRLSRRELPLPQMHAGAEGRLRLTLGAGKQTGRFAWTGRAGLANPPAAQRTADPKCPNCCSNSSPRKSPRASSAAPPRT